MRKLRGLLAAVGLAITMAGCDPLDRQYFQSGIGTDLYTSDIAAVTQLQDVYLGELCRQSLPTFSSAQVTECANSWNLIVEAGMNDIDQRCDSYLSWLNDKRRTNAAIIKQFGDIAWATQNIMNITGASANPITIVGTAFGLATNTFTNVNSRLLFEVDRTTVQTLVLNRRNDYRKSLAQIEVVSRPAAVHALRSYLTICTPFAIETDINTTVTIFQQGGAKGNTTPLVDPTTVARPTIMSTRPPPIAPPPPQIIGGAIGPVEKAISRASGRAIQRALCVPDTGEFATATRVELKNFKAASLYPTDAGATDTIATDADLRRLRDAQRKFPSCQAAGFANGYEVGLFTRFGEAKMREDLKLALETAGLAVPADLVAASAQRADAAVRQAITGLRSKYGLPGQAVFDRTFYDTMQNNLAR